ncbi:MAG TPA: F0F1 ATP synthase subunit delta [Candidatus Paceibacterota bacterium]
MKYTPSQYATTLYDLLEENPKKQKETVKAFAQKLVANGSVKDLRAIESAFVREWYDRKGITPVTVTAGESGAYTKKEIEKITGKEIELTEIKDPGVGAGARIRIGDYQIDNTLARRLSDLTSALTK